MNQNLKKYFQWGINALVVFIFIYGWAVPYIYSILPYEDDVLPDEVVMLDKEIDRVLRVMESTFADMYNSRGKDVEYTLSYLSTRKAPLSNQENYAKSVESIVYITSEDSDGWGYWGTGTIIDKDGLIMTNYHVLEGAVKVVVTTYEGVHYPVTSVVASDESLDILFLKIDAQDLPAIAIGDSDAIRIGDDTLVIGHAEGFINTLSVGNVAGIRSYVSQGFGTNIQITNPISLGNSGGAVLNTYGEIIAIPTWSVEYEGNTVQVQNLNFAVPINEALKVLEGK